MSDCLFTVKCQDVHITVTKDALLELKSDYFDALLRTGFRENTDHIIVLPDVFANDFAFVMKPTEWFSAVNTLNLEQWGRILILADRLQIPILFYHFVNNIIASFDCWKLSDTVMNLILKHGSPIHPGVEMLRDRVFDGELDCQLVKSRFIDTCHRNVIPNVIVKYVSDPRCTPYFFSLFVSTIFYNECSLYTYVQRGLIEIHSAFKMMMHRQMLKDSPVGGATLRVVESDDKESPIELVIEFNYAYSAYTFGTNRYKLDIGSACNYKDIVTHVEYRDLEDKGFRTCSIDQIDFDETFENKIKIKAFI